MAQLTAQFFQTILALEGGYQDLEYDTGNYACGQLVGTNMGISAPALQSWYGRCPTRFEMENLSQTDAWNFYSWYFDRYNAFKIESQQLAELVMHNTMSNPGAAARIEQRVLNSLGYQLAVDGVRGPATVNALNAAWKKSPAELYNGIRQGMIDFYKSLNRPEFEKNWLRRMDKFPAISATAAAGAAGGVLLLFLLLVLWKK